MTRQAEIAATSLATSCCPFYKPLERSVTFDVRLELRFGPINRFRVFYRIREPAREVHILAIGVKERDKVSIGGEEYDL